MKSESGLCANCGRRIYRLTTGGWKHCYTVSDHCDDGGKVMAKKDAANHNDPSWSYPGGILPGDR